MLIFMLSAFVVAVALLAAPGWFRLPLALARVVVAFGALFDPLRRRVAFVLPGVRPWLPSAGAAVLFVALFVGFADTAARARLPA